jgi:hypothetical protein
VSCRRELYSIDEARALLGGIARNELMRSASLPSVLIGRRRFISADSISAFIAAASTTISPAVSGAKLHHVDAADDARVQDAARGVRQERIGRGVIRFRYASSAQVARSNDRSHA